MMLFQALLSMQRHVAIAIKSHPYLFSLLVVAFGFRLSGVFWGLPPFDERIYHPDEPKIIRGAQRFPLLSGLEDLRYPTACHHMLGALTWPIKKVLEAIDYGANGFVYLSGRVLSVVLGTATVLLIYLLARRFYDKLHALVAATALAFSMFHVTNSAWATTDVATSFFLTLFLLLTTQAIEHQTACRAIIAGVALGLLVGSKYTGAIAVVPLFVLVLNYQRFQKSDSLWRLSVAFCTDKVLWVVGLSSLFVFLLSTPGILLNPDVFLSSIEYERARMAQSQLPLSDIYVWKTTFAMLVRTLGTPLAVSACLGLCISCISRRSFEIAIAALVAIFIFYFGSSLYPRYVIMIMPVLAIFSARALLFFHSSKRPWLRIGSLLVSTCVLLNAFSYCALAILSCYPDTRSAATHYSRENIPSGSTIGIAYTSTKIGWKRHPWRYPKIDFDAVQYVDFLKAPEYIVVSSYDSDNILEALQSGLLTADFAVRPDDVNKWYERSPPNPLIFETFYNLYFSESPRYELVQRFSPDNLLAPIEFPPPVIEVFRKKHHGTADSEQQPPSDRNNPPETKGVKREHQ